jgi:hypothetical protein
MMDSVMRRTIEHKQRGIKWDLTSKFEHMDFADDIHVCLLAQNFKDTPEKLVDLNRKARKVVIKISQAKTKAMRINNKNTFTVYRKVIGNVDKFPYLGSVVTKEGGNTDDVRNKISQANGASNQLQKVWKSSVISLRTKLRIFNSNVKLI